MFILFFYNTAILDEYDSFIMQMMLEEREYPNFGVGHLFSGWCKYMFDSYSKGWSLNQVTPYGGYLFTIQSDRVAIDYVNKNIGRNFVQSWKLQLFYTMEGNSIKWNQCVKSGQGSKYASAYSINQHLRRFVCINMQKWLALNKNRVPIRPYEIYNRLQSYQKQQWELRRKLEIQQKLARIKEKEKLLLFRQKMKKQVQQGIEGCGICLLQINLEVLQKSQSLHQLLCGHIFHYGCILKWCKRKNECPLCKNKGTVKKIQ